MPQPRSPRRRDVADRIDPPMSRAEDWHVTLTKSERARLHKFFVDWFRRPDAPTPSAPPKPIFKSKF